jgi:predicted HTH domain antitoxin
MNKKYSSISLRLENDLVEKIEQVSRLEDIEKSVIYRQSIKKGIKEILKELAIKLYVEEKLTISGAARLSDMYIGDFMELLGKRGIKNELPDEYMRMADKNAEKLFKKINKLNSPKKKVIYKVNKYKK